MTPSARCDQAIGLHPASKKPTDRSLPLPLRRMQRGHARANPATTLRTAARTVGLLGILSACLLLGGCNYQGLPLNANGGIGGGLGNADPATRAACTQSAERVYNVRNRGDIYAPQSSVNAPFSANYGAGSTERGLSDQYAREAMIRDCVRNTGTETNRSVPPTPRTPSPVARP